MFPKDEDVRRDGRERERGAQWLQLVTAAGLSSRPNGAGGLDLWWRGVMLGRDGKQKWRGFCPCNTSASKLCSVLGVSSLELHPAAFSRA